jgi:hypothetical protein
VVYRYHGPRRRVGVSITLSRSTGHAHEIWPRVPPSLARLLAPAVALEIAAWQPSASGSAAMRGDVHKRGMRPSVRALLVAIGVGLAGAWPASLSAATPNDVAVSADPANWTPHVLDGQVNAIVQIGNEIVVGGEFSQVQQPGGVILNRSNIFAFNATTGAIDPNFAPVLDRPVNALAPAPDGQSVLLGGTFSTVNGQTIRRLVELSLGTGQPITTFKAKPNAAVYDLALANGDLFVAGAFSKISGTPRAALAAVDATTGAIDANFAVSYSDPRSTSLRTGTLSVNDIAVTPDGTRLVTAGNFQHVNGLDRNQLAVLDLTTTPISVVNWETDSFKFQCRNLKSPYWIRDVAVSPNSRWFAVVTTGWYSQGNLCDTTTRWELGDAGTGITPTWVDYSGGDTQLSVAVTSVGVYVGGHQRWENNPYGNNMVGPGAVPRSGIAALDTLNGLPLSWNPGRKPRGEGASALLATAAGLWVGSDTNYIGGEYHARLAFMPAAGGKALPTALPGTLPGDLYSLDLDGFLRKRSFDGTTAGSSSVVDGPPDGTAWSHGRGAYMLSGSIYTGWDDGNLYVRSYDGSTIGAPTALNLYGLTSAYFPIANVTGMFFDGVNNRLYYTVAGDAHMFFRYFTPESGVVGAETFVASGVGDGLDWSTVNGMTLASGRIYFSRTDGKLRSIQFAAGRPVPGTETVVSSTGDWRSRGLFVFSPPR